MARKSKQTVDRLGSTDQEPVQAEPRQDQPEQETKVETTARETTSQPTAAATQTQDATLGETLHFTVKERRPLKETTQKRYAQIDKRKRKEQSEQTTLVLMLLIDGMVSAAFGPECAMNDAEREMISQPLTRILARMSPATSAMLDKYTDPVMLLFGVIMWGSRIAFTLRERDKEKAAEVQAAQQPEPTPQPIEPTPLRMVAPDLAGAAATIGQL